MPDQYRDFIKDFAITDDTEIWGATMEETARDRDKYWRNWCKIAGIMGVDPELDDQWKAWLDSKPPVDET